jgi:hypothetical protein
LTAETHSLWLRRLIPEGPEEGSCAMTGPKLYTLAFWTGESRGLTDTDHQLGEALAAAYRRVKGSRLPAFSIDFYPYSGLRHTIRLREGRLVVRISDIFVGAPLEVLAALIGILVNRLFRRKPVPHELEIYRVFANREEIRHKTRQVRIARSRKRLGSPSGRVFDLTPLFHSLNERYFGGKVQVERVGWGPRASRRILGHFDPAHRTISLSRWLDSPRVPGYVVEYVLYHEMLHVWFDEETCGGRRRVHHGAFRQAERRFHDYQAARSFLRSSL